MGATPSRSAESLIRGARGAVARPMPEGHTIHRLARDQTPDLVGHALRLRSEQGMFGAQPAARAALAAAEVLDGARLERIDAYGRHLLYRFTGREEALHVHLGRSGRVLPASAPRCCGDPHKRSIA